MNIRLLIFCLILTGCFNRTGKEVSTAEKSKDWALTGFIKADSINPILNPSPDQVFECPVSRKEVRWEERNVLNPSAVVKDGKVWLIYRAQDNDSMNRFLITTNTGISGFSTTEQPIPKLP